MGTLARFDMKAIADRYAVRHFIETGTGDGTGLAYAANCRDFESLWSCEIEPSLCDKAKDKFRYDKRIRLSDQPSANFLANIIDLLPTNEPALFWLDAHFPGADYKLKGYGAEKSYELRVPLASELAVIAEARSLSNDIIICDDARIFVDGPYRNGNLPVDLRQFCPRERGFRFIPQSFETTHDRTVVYDHEGYIVLTPKGTPWR